MEKDELISMILLLKYERSVLPLATIETQEYVANGHWHKRIIKLNLV